MEKKEIKSESKDVKKKKKVRGTGFAVPEYGVVVPDDVEYKVNPDGTEGFYFPDGKKWNPYEENEK